MVVSRVIMLCVYILKTCVLVYRFFSLLTVSVKDKGKLTLTILENKTVRINLTYNERSSFL